MPACNLILILIITLFMSACVLILVFTSFMAAYSFILFLTYMASHDRYLHYRVIPVIQGTFVAHSGNLRCTFREHSLHI
jgi:hypothetical protein